MSEFQLPDVGEGLTEAEIVAWKVKVGDTIEINDVIVEIETAKSLVELPSPYEGTVLALLVAEGETVAGRHPDHLDRRRGRRSPASTPAEQTSPTPTWGSPRRPAARRPRRHRPVQPGRVRRRGGRVPRRPDQGRAWPDAPRPSRLGVPEHRRRRARPSCRCRARSRPAAPVAGRLPADESPVPAAASARPRPAPPRPAPAARRAARGAGQAAGAQARQGPRRRPAPPHRRPARRARSPATTSRPRPAAPAPSWRSGRAAERRRRRAGERETPRADQGRAQDDGGRRWSSPRSPPARHRVDHRRRHPHDAARRAAEEAPRVPRRQGLPAARRSPTPSASR